MLGHKKRLNKFKKIEIISSISSDHYGTKLEINYKKKTEKNVEIKQYATELSKAHSIIKGEIKKYLENSENRNMTYENLWDTAKEVLRGKFIVI